MRQHVQTPTQPTPERPLTITSIEETDVEMLPTDIVLAAAKYADIEYARGEMIPNDQVFDQIDKQFGWK